MRTLLCYLAHPYGGKPENLALARTWLRDLNREHFPVRAFIAPWIDWCEAVPETPVNRTAGLAMDCAVVERCHEFWMVGPFASPGMLEEMKHARQVNRFHLGIPHPPSAYPLPAPDAPKVA